MTRRAAPAQPRPEAVIFDLDGTLVDTVATRIRAWLSVFAEYGIPADAALVAPLIGADGRWLAHHVGMLGGRAVDEARAEQIDRQAGAIYGALNTDPRPLPGVPEALAALETAGVPWAIATSSRRAQVATSIAALGLARPPLVVDGTHVAHAKPAPDLLLLAARELGVAPEDAWYVGDSTWDMQAAAAAGMHPVGVTTGAASLAELRGAGAERVLGVLDELTALIGASG
jgi:HAD superfamily hydrolase (TIGR01509 family)